MQEFRNSSVLQNEIVMLSRFLNEELVVSRMRGGILSLI